tara:strand:- start:29 stop:181 length:153 start_codon:yes stop_codon:yes gene_type:complete
MVQISSFISLIYQRKKLKTWNKRYLEKAKSEKLRELEVNQAKINPVTKIF